MCVQVIVLSLVRNVGNIRPQSLRSFSSLRRPNALSQNTVPAASSDPISAGWLIVSRPCHRDDGQGTLLFSVDSGFSGFEQI